MHATEGEAQLKITPVDGAIQCQFFGNWKLGHSLPDFESIKSELSFPDSNNRKIEFDASKITEWDTGLIVFLLQCNDFCESEKITMSSKSLPDNVRRLIDLATAVPEKKDAQKQFERKPLLEKIGSCTIKAFENGKDAITFLGEFFLSLTRFCLGKAKFRWRDLFYCVESCGVQALPIVTLISFLVGLIIAFLGAVVLVRFGAAIYVSYLVGYGMFREMGALMVGIIMAGRTGAAFSAQIGTMKVSEEVDALTTLGVSPVDFIVLPRVIGLVLMMPLLVIYGNLIGILGGFFVSSTMLDISKEQFFHGMQEVVEWEDMCLGFVKGVVFSVLVGLSGCYRGLRCGSSADSVGVATTSAVVTGITLIILANAFIDWLAALYDF